VVLNLANFLSGVEWGKRIWRSSNFAEGSPLIGKSILLPLLVMLTSACSAPAMIGPASEQTNDGQGLVAKIKASYSVILALIVALALYFALDITAWPSRVFTQDRPGVALHSLSQRSSSWVHPMRST